MIGAWLDLAGDIEQDFIDASRWHAHDSVPHEQRMYEHRKATRRDQHAEWRARLRLNPQRLAARRAAKAESQRIAARARAPVHTCAVCAAEIPPKRGKPAKRCDACKRVEPIKPLQ